MEINVIKLLEKNWKLTSKSVLERDPQSELITQAEALLSSQTPTPAAFADMKEKLNKKLAPAEESHHVW